MIVRLLVVACVNALLGLVLLAPAHADPLPPRVHQIWRGPATGSLNVPPATGAPCRVQFGGASSLGDSDASATAMLTLSDPSAKVVALDCDIEFQFGDGTLCGLANFTVPGVGPMAALIGPLKVSEFCGNDASTATACTTVTAAYGLTLVTHALGCVVTDNQVNTADAAIGPKPLLGALVLVKASSVAPMVWQPLGAFETWDCVVIDDATGAISADGNAVLCSPLSSGGEWYCETWAVAVATVGPTAHARGVAQCDGSPEVDTEVSRETDARAVNGPQAGPSVHISTVRCSAYDDSEGAARATYYVICMEPPVPSA